MANDNFETYAADAQRTFTEHTQQFAARMEDAAEFAKGNVDAMFESATKATERMQALTSEMLGFAQSSLEANFAAFREMSQIKDASEFVERQTALAKNSMEIFAKQAQKLNEMTMAAAKDCAEPVNARMAAVGEMVKSGVYKA